MWMINPLNSVYGNISTFLILVTVLPMDFKCKGFTTGILNIGEQFKELFGCHS